MEPILSALLSTRASQEEGFSICNCKNKVDALCETCEEIDRTQYENWCYKWLTHLKNYEGCLETEKAESDRQVQLKVEHTDDKVINIRNKLAILQTQTVSNDSSIEK